MGVHGLILRVQARLAWSLAGIWVCAALSSPAFAQAGESPEGFSGLDSSLSQGPTSQQESEARLTYQRLLRRRDSALIQYNYIIPGKRTPSRREEAFRQYYPHPKDWAPRFFQVHQDFPGTQAAGRSLVWIVRHWKNSDLDMESRGILLKEYLRQPFLYEICHSLERAHQPRGQQDLLFLFQHSPVDLVKAHACQSLCELGMDVLQTKGGDVLRKNIEQYVQLLDARFSAILISNQAGAAWAARYRLELDHLSLGQKVLDWSGPDLDGTVRSLKDTRGSVVLLYFWKSSSRPARLALPHVRSLANKYAGKPFQVFGISADLNASKAKRWQDALQVKFPNWHVPSTAETRGVWGVQSWPRFYVLSPKGRILAARAPWGEAKLAVQHAMDDIARNAVIDAPIPSPNDGPVITNGDENSGPPGSKPNKPIPAAKEKALPKGPKPKGPLRRSDSR